MTLPGGDEGSADWAAGAEFVFGAGPNRAPDYTADELARFRERAKRATPPPVRTPPPGGGDRDDGPERVDPAYPINVTTTYPWRYDTGGARAGQPSPFDRCGYERRPMAGAEVGARLDGGHVEDGRGSLWVPRFDLPHVLARVTYRDAAGRRSATGYLISPDDQGRPSVTVRAVVTDDQLANGEWAGAIGVNLSSDRSIITAAGTAIRHHAFSAPEREATPRADAHTASGHLDVPVPDCLPGGYLATPPVREALPEHAQREREDAMHAVAIIACDRPKIALTMGASAIAPYLGALRRQSFWHDASGEPRMGKSTVMRAAASLWGDPRTGIGVVVSWNATGRGPGRYLGQLGILPPFLDERGMADYDTDHWGRLIFETTESNSRLSAEYRGPGSQQSAPWAGILFSTGNARLLPDLSAGKFAGLPARVIELEAPFTSDATEAELIGEELLPRAYGWLGPEIMRRYSVDQARDLIKQAEALVGMPEGGTPRTIAGNLHAEVAGAMMIDAVLGLAGDFARSAVSAAKNYLDEHGIAPAHDADRVCAVLAEWAAGHRSAWPTATEYATHGLPSHETMSGPTTQARLPGYGQADRPEGIRSDDGQWFYVFPETWRRAVDSIDASGAVALAELHRREQLHVPAGQRRRGEWKFKLPRLGGKHSRPDVYHLATIAIEPPDHDDQGPAEPEPVPELVVAEPAPAETSTLESDDLEAYEQWALSVEPEPEPEPEAEPDEAESDDPEAEPAAEPERVTRFADQWEPADRPEVELPAEPAPASDGPGPGRTDPASVNRSRYTPRRSLRDVPLTEAKRVVCQEAMAALDSGEVIGNALDALVGPYMPKRKDDQGKLRRAAMTIPIPGVLPAALAHAGFQWSREYDGPTVTLDRTAAWPSAASTARLAHGELDHTGEIEFTGRPGIYQVDIFPWPEADRLPNPMGELADEYVGQTLWILEPTVSLLMDLASEGRYPEFSILDSYTSEPTRMNQWVTEYLQPMRNRAINHYGRNSWEYHRAKKAVGQTFSLLLGQGYRKHPNSQAFRPDWTLTVGNHSAVTLWRRADQCLKVCPEYGPVKVEATDELVIPADALDIVTTRDLPALGRPPISIDSDGVKLGTFKVKR